MSIFKDLGRRLKGWPWLFIGPAVAALLAYLFSGLKTVVIPDWLFLALIVGLWLAVVYVFWYIRHNEKKAESSETPKPTEEILFVLGALAEIACQYLDSSALLVQYGQYFDEETADEFTAVVGTLHGSGLVYYYASNPGKLKITDKGSAYYLAHKERPKKAKKK